jgi:hypothetical protein
MEVMSRRILDLAPVWKREVTLADLVAELTPDDLRELTNDMVDAMLELIADCTDEDVTFVPVDPEEPYLDNTYTPFERIGAVNASGAFVMGLGHDSQHLGRIAEIVRQAVRERVSTQKQENGP